MKKFLKQYGSRILLCVGVIVVIVGVVSSILFVQNRHSIKGIDGETDIVVDDSSMQVDPTILDFQLNKTVSVDVKDYYNIIVVKEVGNVSNSKKMQKLLGKEKGSYVNFDLQISGDQEFERDENGYNGNLPFASIVDRSKQNGDRYAIVKNSLKTFGDYETDVIVEKGQFYDVLIYFEDDLKSNDLIAFHNTDGTLTYLKVK